LERFDGGIFAGFSDEGILSVVDLFLSKLAGGLEDFEDLFEEGMVM